MKRDLIVKLHTDFEALRHQEEQTGMEFWLARDLQFALGYAHWRSFEQVIEKAVASCQNAGQDPGDHFARVGKMVDIGSGAQRELEDIALSRYACYLIAQNGDPSKEPIAFAQTYFAVQTRKMEVIEQRLAEVERLTARKKLTESERQLSGIIFERLAVSRRRITLCPRQATNRPSGETSPPSGIVRSSLPDVASQTRMGRSRCQVSIPASTRPQQN